MIALKLLPDWYFNTPEHPHTLNFHDYYSPTFRIFWISMVLCLVAGFLLKTKPENLGAP